MIESPWDGVVVIAMPNPAKTERKYVTHIVKIPVHLDLFERENRRSAGSSEENMWMESFVLLFLIVGCQIFVFRALDSEAVSVLQAPRRVLLHVDFALASQTL